MSTNSIIENWTTKNKPWLWFLSVIIGIWFVMVIGVISAKHYYVGLSWQDSRISLSNIVNVGIAIGTIALAIFALIAYKYAIDQFVRQKRIEKSLKLTIDLNEKFDKFTSKITFRYHSFIPLFNFNKNIYCEIIDGNFSFDTYKQIVEQHLNEVRYLKQKSEQYITYIHPLCFNRLRLICKLNNVEYNKVFKEFVDKMQDSLKLVLYMKSNLGLKINVLDRLISKSILAEVDKRNMALWINEEFIMLDFSKSKTAIEDIFLIINLDAHIT